MTEANVDEWWAVAKEYLDAVWSDENERERAFGVLINHSTKKEMLPNMSPSIVKSRIIDDGLKKSFRALADPAHH